MSFSNNEPRLENIDDYDNLKGEKRKVVISVVFAGLIMGALYAVVYSTDKVDDKIDVEKSSKIIPMK